MIITQVQTHEGVFFTGVGDLGKTINDSRYQSAKPRFNINLEAGPYGVTVTCLNKFMLIPYGAIKAVIGEQQPSKETTVQQAYPITK